MPGAAIPAASASTTHFTGAPADGATWIADAPSNWNGILLLFSHGFGPPVVTEPLGGPAHNAFLDRGYALVGSSYDPTGSWWALKSAVRDQFQTIDAVTSVGLPHRSDNVLAVGTPMGGLVSALEAEQANGHIDGALTTCDAQQAQTTPQGRARLALALALLNAPPAAAGQPVPDPHDANAVEAAEFNGYFGGVPSPMVFIEFGRPAIEQSAGGNGSWTLGVNFSQLLHESPRKNTVEALYREAGLNLEGDLSTLTAGANIPADAGAIAQRTYAKLVFKGGNSHMFRQAYVNHIGYCN